MTTPSHVESASQYASLPSFWNECLQSLPEDGLGKAARALGGARSVKCKRWVHLALASLHSTKCQRGGRQLDVRGEQTCFHMQHDCGPRLQAQRYFELKQATSHLEARCLQTHSMLSTRVTTCFIQFTPCICNTNVLHLIAVMVPDLHPRLRHRDTIMAHLSLPFGMHDFGRTVKLGIKLYRSV